MLPYLVYPVVLCTVTFAMLVPRGLRLSPIVLVGGVHLIYNLMSVLLSQRSHRVVEYFATLGSFVAFALGVVAALWLLRASRPCVVLAALRPSDFLPRHGLKRTASRWNVEQLRVQQFRVRRVLFLALFAIAISTFGYLAYRAGGLPVFESNPNGARLTFFPNGYFSTIVYVGLVGCAVAGGMSLMSPGKTPRPLGTAGVVLISLAALGATGNRGMLLYPVLALGLFAFLKYRLRADFVAGAGSLGLITFSVAGYFRNRAAFGYTYDSDLAAAGYPGILKYLGPLGQYVGGTAETFSRTIDVFPDREPFAMGTQFFSPLLHHESVDLYLKDVFQLDFEGYGLAPGAMNAFYLDFGWAGVAIGFLLLGVLAGYLYGLAVHRSGRFVPAYLLLCVNLLLANYGHPFAYIATLATPLAIIVILAPTDRATGGRLRLGRVRREGIRSTAAPTSR